MSGDCDKIPCPICNMATCSRVAERLYTAAERASYARRVAEHVEMLCFNARFEGLQHDATGIVNSAIAAVEAAERGQ